MRGPKPMLLTITGGAMEFCWLYGWATFMTIAVLHRPFPFLEAAAAFALGAYATRLTLGKGIRVVSVLGVHAAGFAAVAMGAAYAVHASGYGFFDPAWVKDIFGGDHGFVEWAAIVMTLIWALLFWVSGVATQRRPKTYYGFCARLDIGLAALFCLYLVKLLFLVRGNISIEHPALRFMVFPFFLCSLFALGMTRMEGTGFKSFLPGYRGVGVILGFASTVLLLSGCVGLFLMSGMRAAAHAAYGSIRSLAGWSLPFVERSLRILFSRGAIRPEAAAPSKGIDWAMATWGKDSWWMEYVEKIMGWGVWGIFALMAAGTIGMAVIFTVKWLLTRTGGSADRPGKPKGLLLYLRRLWERLFGLAQGLARLVAGLHGAPQVYGALVRWARRAGLSPATGETPSEFGARLGRQFPRIGPDIECVVAGYNEEVYGQTPLAGDGLERLGQAWRRLRSPVHWPRRVKMRLVGERARRSEGDWTGHAA